ncbi:MAG TPA: BrnA antitoxin family protein [Longimicrobiaceae bacterium]|nr:BrnA antitoxin family protein [Longimicrobiaceae bacterium]
MSEERIVRRTLETPHRGRTDWARVDGMSEEQVEAAALADADNPPWTEEELMNARLVMPEDRGKVPISIRLDGEVVDYFKAQGRGYQSRINAVLRAYVRSQRAKYRP